MVQGRDRLRPERDPISQSICAYAAQQHDVFEIPDLTLDPRTANNPLVTGGPAVRFYAGVPLKTRTASLSAPCASSTLSPIG